MSGPERIGIFGGTFDPPHAGHVQVAREVVAALELDRLLWVTAAQPPHKTMDGRTPATLRHEMVECATRDDDSFEASRLEIDRVGPSFTVDTLEDVRATAPDAEIFLIIGADQYRQFRRWRRPERILELARLAVMDRNGETMHDVAGEALLTGPVPLHVGRVDVSSSEIRRLGAADPWSRGVIPSSVLEVIDREGLYRGRDAPERVGRLHSPES